MTNTMKIGVNPNSLVFFGSLVPFANRLKTGSNDWGGNIATIGRVDTTTPAGLAHFNLDSNFYPTDFHDAGGSGHDFTEMDFVVWGSIPGAPFNYTPVYDIGTFVFLWDGTGDFTFPSASAGVGDLTGSFSGTDGRQVLTSSVASQGISIQLNSTGAGANYAKNFRLIYSPGSSAGARWDGVSARPAWYGDNEWALEHDGNYWNPAYLTKLARFNGSFRFLNWNGVQSSIVSFSNRNTLTNLFWVSVPYEAIVNLCNRLSVGHWTNFPAQVNLDYWKQYANLVKTNLSGSLDAKFEFYNEIWQWGFQTQWPFLQQQGGLDFPNKYRVIGTSSGVSGRVRAQLNFSTSTFGTGDQCIAIGIHDITDGAYTINVIDGTHIDFVGTTFVSNVAGGTAQVTPGGAYTVLTTSSGAGGVVRVTVSNDTTQNHPLSVGVLYASKNVCTATGVNDVTNGTYSINVINATQVDLVGTTFISSVAGGTISVPSASQYGAFGSNGTLGTVECWARTARMFGVVKREFPAAKIVINNQNGNTGTVISTRDALATFCGGLNASFTGTISGTSLTATSITGDIAVGQEIAYSGSTIKSYIVSGSAGSWVLDVDPTSGSGVGPIAMTSQWWYGSLKDYWDISALAPYFGDSNNYIMPEAWSGDSDKGVAKISQESISGGLLPANSVNGNTTGGTSTAYTLVSSAGWGNGTLPAEPANGQVIVCKIHTSNGASPTLAVDGGTAWPIQDLIGTSVGAGFLGTNERNVFVFTSSTYSGAVTKGWRWVFNVGAITATGMTTETAAGYSACKAVADAIPKTTEGYEGGQTMVYAGNADYNNMYSNWNVSYTSNGQNIKDVYASFYLKLQAAGCQVFVHYTDIGQNSGGFYWPLITNINQSNAPKWDATMDFLNPPVAASTDGPVANPPIFRPRHQHHWKW